MSEPREICPKTKRPCAAGCFDLVFGVKRTGYCYEKDKAGDYANSTLVERARILAMLEHEAERGPVGAAAACRYAIGLIERGEHDRPEPATREGAAGQPHKKRRAAHINR